MNNAVKALIVVVVSIGLSVSAMAQLSGTKTIPGNYATISAAVADLNTQGVGPGGVTFNVAAGYTETLSGPIAITATGTSGNPIIFQKSGAGANPLVTAYVGTSTPGSAAHDDIWRLNGSDYVTIDGIDLLDPNTTNPESMEGGYVLYKASASDGAQNNTIKNCVITLNRVNNAAGSGPSVEGSRGIEVTNATSAAATTALTPTDAGGANSNNKFYHNTIQNCNYGIVLSGYAAASPFTLGDTGNDVGGSSALTGNTILNFGGAAAAANPAAGIRANNQWGVNMSYNTINNNDGAGVNHPSTLRGIYAQAGTSANATINNNTITIHGGATTSQVSGIENAIGSTAASNTVSISNNNITGDYLTATTGTFYVLYSSASAATVNITGNTIHDLTYSGSALAGSGAVYGIYNTGAATNLNVRGNTVSNISRTGTTGGTTIGIYASSGTNQTVKLNTVFNFGQDGTGAGSTMYGIQTTTGTIVCDSNIVHDLTVIKTSGTGSLYGVYNISSPTNENYNYNQIYNLTHNGTGTTYGLYAFTTTGVRTVSNNLIYGVSTAGLTVGGINQSSSSPTIFNNKVYNIQSTSTGAPTVFGIAVASVGTSGAANMYNNLIGNLSAPNASSSAVTAPTLRGINITSATATSTVALSYNTVYLNGSSTGTNFGTAALYVTSSATATTASLTMRNNIFVNLATPAGTGYSVAYQRSGVDLANYAAASNNNLFYAGTPGAANLIFFDGTNSDQTLSAFKTRVASRENLSVTENPPFVSTTGSDATFLHISTSTPTRVESGGTVVAGITTDYDGNTRNATTPDIGADEFTGIAIDENPPVIAYTPLGNTGSTGARTLTATITDPSGVPTSGIGLPRLYWKINSGAYASATASSLGSGQYQFSFGGGVVVGDTVSYYIAAQDGAAPPNVGVQPSGGASGFTANPPAASTPPTSPSFYTVTQPPLSGDYTVGVAMFNRITGRTITFQKSVRKVMRESIEESPAEKGESPLVATPEVKGVKKLVEVDEVSWIPMENGRSYEGSLYVGKDEHPGLNWPANVSGVYATITAAVADLNLRGVSGNTRFLLTDAAYTSETFPIVVSVTSASVPSSSATVTIKPNTGVTATVSGASASSVILKVFNTNYVTVDGSNTNGGTTRDLTLENTSTTSPSVVWFGSNGTTPITNGTLKNCIVRNGINTSTPVVISDGAALGSAGYFSNMTIENNSIQKGYIGVYSTGGTIPQGGSNLIYRNNDLTTSGANSVRYTGLYMQGVNGAQVVGNTIANFDGTSSEDDRGIWLATGTTNAVVDHNLVYTLKYTGTGGYGCYGVAVSTGDTTGTKVISNNVMYDLSGDGWNYTSILGDNPMGVYAFSTQTGVKIHYNSINLFGNTLNQTSALASGITLGTGTVADVRDNVIVNNLGLLAAVGYGTAGVYVQTGASQLIASNYNDYVVNPTGSGVKAIGQIATTASLTLADWRTATSQDLNSISADPLFVSNTDLRPYSGSPVLGAGVQIAGITTDFLGVTRGNPPSIGAYEQGVSANMTYTSSTTTQTNTSPVAIGATDQQIIGMQVVTTGSSSPLSATRFLFNTNGSTAASDIANAKVWYTGTSSIFGTTTQFGSTVNAPNGAFAVNGSQVLAAGTNYFWLTYSISSGAVHGHVVDAQCDSLYVAGGRVPTVTAPAGNRTIQGTAAIVTRPDSLVKSLGHNATATDTVVIRNTGNGPLTWSISDENARPAMPPASQLKYFTAGPQLPKGQDYPPVDHPDTTGGPDAFGYKFIDSDSPGGPTFNWVDISSTGTQLDSSSAWVPTGTFAGYDEGYYPVVLPFSFSYYGNSKDTLFIGSNGNVMFQRPTANIFTNAAFPTAGGGIDEHIGVWWDDQWITNGARVYYGLSGGNFVVQFVNIPLYNGTVPNYTYEVILSPSGTITTQYLAMAINGGTLTASSIGMENATGTVGLQVVFNAAYMHNNLAIRFSLPDATWLTESPVSGSVNPGDSAKVAVTFNSTGLVDSTYRAVLKVASNDPVNPTKSIPVRLTVSGGSSTVNVNTSIATGWNMISNPVTNPVPDDSAKHLFPTIISRVFSFSAGYVAGDVMLNGKGYWGKFPAATTNVITGTARTRDSISVSAGWNMIGSISNPVDTSTITSVPAGIRASNWFGFAGGYAPASQIASGKGYWVKASAAGKFVFANPPASRPAKPAANEESVLDALNSITITDANGSSQTLYFGVDTKNTINVSMFAMPPAPPAGVLNARFETADGGSMVQTHAVNAGHPVSLPVTVQASAYPVTVSWKLVSGSPNYELSDALGGRAFRTHELGQEGSIEINNSDLSRIVINLVGDGSLPKEFALSQNYPNPFNPTTSMTYALPVDSRVTVEIFNVIGQRVRTLVNGDVTAGYHVAEWDGTGNGGQHLASGVYMLQMSAKGVDGKSFNQVRKLMMLK